MMDATGCVEREDTAPHFSNAATEPFILAPVLGATPVNGRYEHRVRPPGPDRRCLVVQVAVALRAVAVLRAAHLARGGGRRADDRVETYHDRVRAALLASISERTRRNLHAALARALASRAGTDPQVLVAHLEHAGDAAGAAFHAERGARAAAENLAFELAASLWATALRLGAPPPERRRELERARADALANAGRGAEAASAYLAAADGLEPTERLECRRRAAEHLLGSGHIAAGLEVLRDVLAEFDETIPATSRGALVRLVWQRVLIRFGGLRWRERDVGAIPPRELVRLDAFKAVAVCLGPIDLVRGAESQARLLRAALRTGERRQASRALALEAVYRSIAGHTKETGARAVLAQAKAIAEAAGEPYLRAFVIGAEGMLEHSVGRYVAAAALLAEAEDALHELSETTAWDLGIVRMFRLISIRLCGDFGAIRGPLRFDLFWGTGREAGAIAGRQRHDVAAWILVPKGATPAALLGR